MVGDEFDTFPAVTDGLRKDVAPPLEGLLVISSPHRFDPNGGVVSTNIFEKVVDGVRWADETEDVRHLQQSEDAATTSPWL